MPKTFTIMMKTNETKKYTDYVSFRRKAEDTGQYKYYIVKCTSREQADLVHSVLKSFDASYARIGKMSKRQDKMRRTVIDAEKFLERCM